MEAFVVRGYPLEQMKIKMILIEHFFFGGWHDAGVSLFLYTTQVCNTIVKMAKADVVGLDPDARFAVDTVEAETAHRKKESVCIYIFNM
jgi:hypothetical protein